MNAFACPIRAGCPIVEVRFARDSPLEEAGFEVLVPRKAPGSMASIASGSRRSFLVAGNQAEATSGGLALGRVTQYPGVRIRLPPAASAPNPTLLGAPSWRSPGP